LDHCGISYLGTIFSFAEVEKVATVMVEETQRVISVLDAYPVDLEITPRTGTENLREIGAIGTLLVELIRDTCGLKGRITVEESIDGIRIRVEPKEEQTPLPLIGGG
jgi:hypothetical protein